MGKDKTNRQLPSGFSPAGIYKRERCFREDFSTFGSCLEQIKNLFL